MLFKNRAAAGQLLATKLAFYAHLPEGIVVGLPRGGVPVAFEVAKALHLPLDVFLVRKLGVPGQEELALGAIAEGGTQVLNQPVIHSLKVSDPAIEAVIEREKRELERRSRLYRADRPPLNATGRVVILVDDGLATGATMLVAVRSLRQQHPDQLVVAVPVAASETCDFLRTAADAVICAETPDRFGSVGVWYQDFSQTTDEEVKQLLQQARDCEPLFTRGAP